MEIVKSCDNVHSAYLICGVLANEGIESQVLNENINMCLPYAPAINSLRVQVVVDEQDIDRALEVLKELEDTSAEVCCPYCNSNDVDSRFPLAKRSNVVIKYFFLLLALISLSPIGSLSKVNYCKTCNKEFGNS